MHVIDQLETISLEAAQYFPVGREYLYTVHHPAPEPIACVLLAGSFASERHSSYLPLVRWCRYLAARRVAVMRYDYRGVGESTGCFEEMSFDEWKGDVRELAQWVKSIYSGRPVVLQGLEVGGLLAASAFQEGFGDHLLLWSPPRSANEALRSTMVHWLRLQHMAKAGTDRKPLTHYLETLESGPAEIDGYQWSARMWKDSQELVMPAGLTESGLLRTDKRKVKLVKLGREAAPLVKGGVGGYDEIKDFDWLFAENFEWLASTVSLNSENQ